MGVQGGCKRKLVLLSTPPEILDQLLRNWAVLPLPLRQLLLKQEQLEACLRALRLPPSSTATGTATATGTGTATATATATATVTGMGFTPAPPSPAMGSASAPASAIRPGPPMQTRPILAARDAPTPPLVPPRVHPAQQPVQDEASSSGTEAPRKSRKKARWSAQTPELDLDCSSQDSASSSCAPPPSFRVCQQHKCCGRYKWQNQLFDTTASPSRAQQGSGGAAGAPPACPICTQWCHVTAPEAVCQPQEVYYLPCPASSSPAAIAAMGPVAEAQGGDSRGLKTSLPLYRCTTKHCSTFSNSRLLPCERCYTGVMGVNCSFLDASGDVIDTWQKAAQLGQTQAPCLPLSPMRANRLSLGLAPPSLAPDTDDEDSPEAHHGTGPSPSPTAGGSSSRAALCPPGTLLQCFPMIVRKEDAERGLAFPWDSEPPKPFAEIKQTVRVDRPVYMCLCPCAYFTNQPNLVCPECGKGKAWWVFTLLEADVQNPRVANWCPVAMPSESRGKE